MATYHAHARFKPYGHIVINSWYEDGCYSFEHDAGASEAELRKYLETHVLLRVAEMTCPATDVGCEEALVRIQASGGNLKLQWQDLLPV
jgi:hypothetical protein